jgi:predicted TPR repeat methyltransferase
MTNVGGDGAEVVSTGERPAAALSLAEAMDLAVGLHKQGFLDAASEIYERVLGAEPDHPDAIHLLGLSMHQQGRHGDALELVGRAVALTPTNADARNNLGNMLLHAGRLAEAEAEYRQVVALRPDFAGAHANLGVVLRRLGDGPGAEAALRQALSLDPGHGGAYHNLGSLMRDAGRTGEALTAYQRALALMPYDGESYRRVGATLYTLGRIGDAREIYERWLALEPQSAVARHMVAACSGREVPIRASDEFVERTFDSFANSFDLVLERLKYQAPALVAQAVAAALGPPAGTLDVLDAGAGTGLCGPLLRPFARHLVGVDLSSAMLAKAEERATYDALDTAELTAYLRAHPAAFDLIVSADTLVYFGDLAAPLAAAAGSLRQGGHLVFTVERAPDVPHEGYHLSPHGRYSHSEEYLRAALAAAGLAPRAINPAHLRIENLQPVEGYVVTAESPIHG